MSHSHLPRAQSSSFQRAAGRRLYWMRTYGRRRTTSITQADVKPQQNVTSKTADDDYVMLRKLREKKSRTEHTQFSKLESIVDEIKRKASEIHDVPDGNAHVQNSAKMIKISTPFDEYRIKLFNEVENGSPTDLSCIISQAESHTVKLTQCVDPINGMNVFHHSVLRNLQSAMFLLEGDHVSNDLLSQTYELNVNGSCMVRNTLHLIAEKGNVELAKLFVSKVGDHKARQMMLEETPMEVSGEWRPLPCLHIAAFVGNVDLTTFFLEKGTRVDHLNSKDDTALLLATRRARIKVMQLLISKDADPNLANDNSSTPLHLAVRYNLLEAVEILVTRGGAKIDQERKVGLVAPIVMAAAFGYDKIIEILIKAGGNVNLEVNGHEMALHHAVREGHIGIVKMLINNGAKTKLNNQDNSGNTPLILAAQYDNSDILDVLLSNGTSVTNRNHDGKCVWHWSLLNADNTCLAVLVRAMQESGDRNRKVFYTSKPPLSIAATLGVIDKIEFLIDVGLSPTETDSLGNNMIHHAAKVNNHKVITEFNSYVSLDTTNDQGDTALHLACAEGHAHTIDILLKLKAKANIKNLKGETALHILVKSPDTTTNSVAKLLNYMSRTHSSDLLHTQDNDGNNALHVASMFASTDIIWELRIVKFKQTNNDGNTAFHTAIIPERPEVFQTILDIYDEMKRDANLNVQNKNEETVVHLAALAGDADGIARLITYGADLSAQDKDGNTALHRLATRIEECHDGVLVS